MKNHSQKHRASASIRSIRLSAHLTRSEQIERATRCHPLDPLEEFTPPTEGVSGAEDHSIRSVVEGVSARAQMFPLRCSFIWPLLLAQGGELGLSRAVRAEKRPRGWCQSEGRNHPFIHTDTAIPAPAVAAAAS